MSSPASDTHLPEFVGAWPRLRGRQEPEFESRWDGDDEDGDRAARLGARIGMRCMPWQWRILRAVLSRQPVNEWGERLWTHRDVCIECTRQNGKTLIIVLRIIFGMLMFGEKIAYTAQEWETAKDVYGRVLDVIERVPSLKKRVRGTPSTAGNRGLIKLGRGECKFGPRTEKFGRGLTEVDLLFIDEAYDLTAMQEASLTGATRASKNPQIWYVSTAPVASVHPNCHLFSGVTRLGLARSPDLYFVRYAAPEGTELGDVDAYRLAHPSLGVVGDERELEAKRRKARTVEQRAIFQADYLGIGEYPPDEEQIGTPLTGWENLAVTGPVLVGEPALAVHRSRDRRRWAIVAAQFDDGARVHLEAGPVRSGSHTDIAEYLVTKVTEWNPVGLVMDRKNGATVLDPLLRKAGIEATITNTADMAHACGGFLDDVVSGQITHHDQAVLNDAVESAVMRELPGGDFAWLEDDAGVAAFLVAASLAHWQLLRAAAPAAPAPAPSYDPHPTPDLGRAGTVLAGHFDVMTANF